MSFIAVLRKYPGINLTKTGMIYNGYFKTWKRKPTQTIDNRNISHASGLEELVVWIWLYYQK